MTAPHPSLSRLTPRRPPPLGTRMVLSSEPGTGKVTDSGPVYFWVDFGFGPTSFRVDDARCTPDATFVLTAAQGLALSEEPADVSLLSSLIACCPEPLRTRANKVVSALRYPPEIERAPAPPPSEITFGHIPNGCRAHGLPGECGPRHAE